MKKLTAAEEEIMQILWAIEQGFVKDIIEQMPEPKPSYTTVSTIVRILETKEFVGFTAFGKSHRYFPIVSKEAYREGIFNTMLSDYFSGSFSELISFFTKKKGIDTKELENLLREIEDTDHLP